MRKFKASSFLYIASLNIKVDSHRKYSLIKCLIISKNEHQQPTSYIKHLAASRLSSISARIKSTCNLTGKCFEMPNVSYT